MVSLAQHLADTKQRVENPDLDGENTENEALAKLVSNLKKGRVRFSDLKAIDLKSLSRKDLNKLRGYIKTYFRNDPGAIQIYKKAGSQDANLQKQRTEKKLASGEDVVPKGFDLAQLSTMQPEQKEILKRGYKELDPESYLSKLQAGGDEEFWRKQEEPGRRQFQEEMGQLNSRFAELAPGALSLKGSSAQQNAQSQAAIDYQTRRDALRHGLVREAQQDYSKLRGELLGYSPESKFLVEKEHKQPPIPVNPPESAANRWGREALRAGSTIAGAYLGAA